MTGSGVEGVEQLCVSDTGLTLAPATDLAASSDEESCQHDGKDGREPRAERCPMYVNEAESIVGLVECDVVCLLYTSPSPRDRQKSRMPSSA